MKPRQLDPRLETPWWRLWAYEFLTQVIIAAGLLRKRVAGRWDLVRKDRVFDLYDREYDECCDCGLEHKREFFRPGTDCGHKGYPGLVTVGHAYPARPSGYAYRLRAGAGAPSLAVPR